MIKEINFRNFWMGCFLFQLITVMTKKNTMGIITKIISPLIMKPKTKKLADIDEYSILFESKNFLKYKNPARRKNTDGALLNDVWEYAKNIVLNPNKNARDNDVLILYLKARAIKKKVATERDEKNEP